MPDDNRDNDLGLLLITWVGAVAFLVLMMWLVVSVTSSW
jgi:hypothetical protein